MSSSTKRIDSIHLGIIKNSFLFKFQINLLRSLEVTAQKKCKLTDFLTYIDTSGFATTYIVVSVRHPITY